MQGGRNVCACLGRVIRRGWYILDTGGQNALCRERELEGFSLYVVLVVLINEGISVD